jgi:hypothetical protein
MLLIIYIPVTRVRENGRRSRVGGGNAIDGEQEGDLWYPRSGEPRALETLRVLLCTLAVSFPPSFAPSFSAPFSLSLSLSLSLGPCRRLKRLADLLPKRGGKMST